jgi:hypothetical protein
MMSHMPGTVTTAMDRGTATGTAPDQLLPCRVTVPHELNVFARTSPASREQQLVEDGRSLDPLEVASDSSAHRRSMALYLELWRVPVFQLGGPGVLDFGNAVLEDAFELGQCRSVPVGFHIEPTEGFAKEIEEISIGLEAHGWKPRLPESQYAAPAFHRWWFEGLPTPAFLAFAQPRFRSWSRAIHLRST